MALKTSTQRLCMCVLAGDWGARDALLGWEWVAQSHASALVTAPRGQPSCLLRPDWGLSSPPPTVSSPRPPEGAVNLQASAGSSAQNPACFPPRSVPPIVPPVPPPTCPQLPLHARLFLDTPGALPPQRLRICSALGLACFSWASTHAPYRNFRSQINVTNSG